MKNPNKHSEYETNDKKCNTCKYFELNKRCDNCTSNPACDGFADEKGIYCCNCYKLLKKVTFEHFR